MSIAPDSFLDSKQRVVRVVGRDLLSRVREKSENLGVEEERDALHDFRVAVRRLRSWIRAFDDELSTTVRPKVQRRLKRIADATRTSRDSEVHIEWLERFARSRREKYDRAIEWLLDDLRRRKADADLALREAVDKDLDRTATQLGHGLAHYVVNLDEHGESIAMALATLIREHATNAAERIDRIESVGDRAEAHEARISVKRLRYLIEPLGDAIPDAGALVDDLAKPQDDLGGLHDAQIFGSEIAKRLARVLAADGPNRENGQGHDDGLPLAANDRADALRAISQRLHREERRAFASLGETWLKGGAQSLWSRAEAVAQYLESVPVAAVGSP